jgi:6-phosphogluconate dehydrogenase
LQRRRLNSFRSRWAHRTFLLDKILDAAGQKGTGKWTAQVALDTGTLSSM